MEKVLSEKFIASFEYETGRSLLILDLAQPKNELIYDYQIQMITNNPDKAVIPFDIRRKDEKIGLYYDISGKQTLAEYLKDKKLSTNEFVYILSMILKTILESKGLFLNEKNFLISEDYIFIEPAGSEPSLVYLPVSLKAENRQMLKEFVIKLISRIKPLGAVGQSDCLQEIMQYVKSSDLCVQGLNQFLNGMIKTTYMNPAFPPQTNGSVLAAEHTARQKGSNDKAEDALEVSVPTADQIHGTCTHGPVGIVSVFGRINYALTAIAVLSQIAVTGLAFALEKIMSTIVIDTLTKYTIIAMFVMVTDLMLYKYFKADRMKWFKNSKADIKLLEPEAEPVMPEPEAEPVMPEPEVEPVMPEPRLHKEFNIVNEIHGSAQSAYMSATGLESDLSASGFEETALLCRERINAFLVCENNSSVDKVIIEKDRFLIGRNPEAADMVINQRSIGRIHAEIVSKDGEFYIIDKDSRNGTYINDTRLEGGREYKLGNADNVVFANLEYKFYY